MFFLKFLIDFLKKYYALLIGLVVVSILSAITYHGDFYMISKMSERVAGGNFHIYDNLFINGIDYGKFIMPPLIFLVDGAIFFIFKLLHIINFDFGLGFPSFWESFLLKSRYILLFLLSYPLIKQAALSYTKNDNKLSNRIANLWITSPLLLFLPFAQGNNDIIPVFFTLIFLFFAFKKKYLWAMVFLGLTAALKNYALFLIPPMAIILSDRDIKKTLKYGIIAGVAYLAPILFYIKDINHFFTGGGEGLYIFKAVIPSHINYMIFPIIYILLLTYLIFDKKASAKTKEADIVFYGFLFMSLFYAISHFFPQWFLWILPFLIFAIYNKRHLFYIYTSIVFVFLFSLITSWSNNLDITLFGPVLSSSANNILFPRMSGLVSLASSVFVGLLLAFIYVLFKERLVADKIRSSEKVTVFLNLLPLILYLVFLSFLVFVSSISESHDQELRDQALRGNYKTIQSFNVGDIKTSESYANINKTGDSYIPTSADPSVVLSLPNTIKESNLYALIEFGGHGVSSPQVYWANDQKIFSEDNSSLSPINLGGNTYLFPLKKTFAGLSLGKEVNIKYLRIDPSNTKNNFLLNGVSIIKL